MKIYTSPGLPEHCVVGDIDGDLWLVDFDPKGWSRRKPYLGYRTNLDQVLVSAERQLFSLWGISDIVLKSDLVAAHRRFEELSSDPAKMAAFLDDPANEG